VLFELARSLVLLRIRARGIRRATSPVKPKIPPAKSRPSLRLVRVVGCSGFRVPPSARHYASGCLPDLDVVRGLVPRWVPAGWHLIGQLDCACQGIWIPRVVGGHSVGSNGTVRTA
jgi:hypothetical protein